jgi:hypothetical protein
MNKEAIKDFEKCANHLEYFHRFINTELDKFNGKVLAKDYKYFSYLQSLNTGTMQSLVNQFQGRYGKIDFKEEGVECYSDLSLRDRLCKHIEEIRYLLRPDKYPSQMTWYDDWFLIQLNEILATFYGALYFINNDLGLYNE